MPIANHLESLALAADNTKEGSSGIVGLAANLLQKLGSNMLQVGKDSFFNFCWVCRRARMFYLLSLITLGVVWGKYEGDVRLRASFLILSLVFIEVILRFHNFNNFYQMYVEGLLMAIMAYNLVRISYRSSPTSRRYLAVFSLVFVFWFSIDDVERKMLWPTFASHVGITLPNLEKMPHIRDRFEGFLQVEKERVEKIKSGILPRTSQPLWWTDNRKFLWADKPWREWPN